MPYQGDWAFVLPSNDKMFELQSQMAARAERQKLLEQKAKQEEEARQSTLLNTVGDAFNDKDYLTGSNFDPFIRQNLAEARAKFADEIRKNPGMSPADLQFRIQKQMSDLGMVASKIKAVRQDIKDRAKAMGDKNAGIDGGAIEKLAMNQFAFKTDDKGNRVLKSLDDIMNDDSDPETLIATSIQNNPDAVVNPTEAWNHFMKGASAQTNKVGRELTVPGKVPGTSKTYDADLELFPWQGIEESNGKFRTDASGKPMVFTKSQRVKVGNNYMDVADDDTYNAVQNTPAMRLRLEAQFKRLNANLGLSPNSPEAEIVKKKILFDDLNQVRPAKDNIKEKETESARLQRYRMEQAGMVINTGSSAEERKKEKEQDKFDNSTIGLLNRSLNGEVQVFGRGKELKDGTFDVTDVVGKLSLGKTFSGKSDYAKRITVNPDTGVLTIYPRTGRPIVMDKQKATDYLAGLSKYNNMDLDKTAEQLGSDPAELKKALDERKRQAELNSRFPQLPFINR